MLAHIRAVVGDPLDRLGDGEQAKRVVDRQRSSSNLLLRGAEELRAEARHRVVKEQDLLGETGVARRERAVGVAQHADDRVGHDPKDIRNPRGQLHIGEHRFGDVDGAVGDAFELVVDLHDGEDRADRFLVGHAHGQERNRGALDLDINAVDLFISGDDQRSLHAIAVEVALDGFERDVEDAVALSDDVVAQMRELVVEVRHSRRVYLWRVCCTAWSSLPRASDEEPPTMPKLCVNIDHVATIRQARRGHEPDPVHAAIEAEAGGADGITVHLREDRRHIQDADLLRIKEVVRTRFNLEMAATEEMVAIAIALKPHLAMFVPERRQEVTTEGGLDVRSQVERIGMAVARLKQAGIPVSAFIDADEQQIEAAARAGFDCCEIHTGPYAHACHGGPGNEAADGSRAVVELAKIAQAAAAIQSRGMQVNAGHGLNTANVGAVAAIKGVRELHIGHSIVSRAVFIGLRAAVAEIKLAMH